MQIVSREKNLISFKSVLHTVDTPNVLFRMNFHNKEYSSQFGKYYESIIRSWMLNVQRLKLY